MSNKNSLKVFALALTLVATLSIGANDCGLGPPDTIPPSDQRFKQDIQPIKGALEIMENSNWITGQLQRQEIPERVTVLVEALKQQQETIETMQEEQRKLEARLDALLNEK